MFYPFFQICKAKGLSITMSEWLTLQDALEQGMAGSSLTQFYYLARMILVKSETEFDKFDMAFEECFKGVKSENEVTAQMLRWLDKSDMMELAHEEARAHLNQMEDNTVQFILLFFQHPVLFRKLCDKIALYLHILPRCPKFFQFLI